MPGKLLDLSGQTALITGASRGIGAATARLLAEAGANVVLVSRNIQIEVIRRDYLSEFDREPLVLQGDVSDGESMQRVYEAAQMRFGRIDIVVNNAAMNSTVPLIEADDAEWLTVLNTNLISAARLCRLVAPGMMSRKHGRIINIASNLGAFALADKGVYSAAKAGLMQLTRNLALEWAAHGILVNAIAAGAINTDFTEATQGVPGRDQSAVVRTILLGRMGTPQEIASVVLFLASPMSTFITGQSIFVDGGASIWYAH